ncbi:MAG TPA: glycoside hydrolase family 16 protein [Chitinophagaceae bacterium]|nr:glycoside hydrolase family 16 protein [Chitinophagaceae bacterium]
MNRAHFFGLICFLFFQNLYAQQTPFAGGSGAFKKLVWSDEFNGSGLPDSAKWHFEKGYVRNNEMQYYTTARPQNAAVKDGFLQLTARHDSLKKDSEMYPVTSASLHTKGTGAWTYGRIEVRAKFPSSLGTWPAIWMLGSDIDSTGWPACGEIDILEHVGYMPDTLHFNVHTGKYNHAIHTNKGRQLYHNAPYSDFHVYAIEWFPDRLDWYFDAQKVFSFTNEKSGVAAWPFNKPQYLILNLAFGGAWGGQRGVALQTLPQTFSVDYVRVFQ